MKIVSSIVIIVLSGTILSSCNCVRSSLEYTMGTQCLDEGNPAEAIIHLKKAVELDPTMSRNQANLATAYIKVGDWENAWYHARKGVLCNDANDIALIIFLNTYGQMVVAKGLNKVETPYIVIRKALGEPDVCTIEHGEENPRFARYGACHMYFSDGVLKDLLVVGFADE